MELLIPALLLLVVPISGYFIYISVSRRLRRGMALTLVFIATLFVGGVLDLLVIALATASPPPGHGCGMGALAVPMLWAISLPWFAVVWMVAGFLRELFVLPPEAEDAPENEPG